MLDVIPNPLCAAEYFFFHKNLSYSLLMIYLACAATEIGYSCVRHWWGGPLCPSKPCLPWAIVLLETAPLPCSICKPKLGTRHLGSQFPPRKVMLITQLQPTVYFLTRANRGFEFPGVPLKSQHVLWMTKDASSDLFNYFFPPFALPSPSLGQHLGYNLFAELQGVLSFFGQPQVDGGLLKPRHSCFLRVGMWVLDCVICRRWTSKEVGSTAGGGCKPGTSVSWKSKEKNSKTGSLYIFTIPIHA